MRSRVVLAAAALILVSACGDDPQPQVASPTPTATSTTAAPTASPTPTLPPGIDQVVRFTIKGKRVEGPSRIKVSKGDTVRLVITSDKADEVHVHTFDNLVKVQAGQPADVDVKATIAGQFEVEMHSTHLLITKLQVQ